MAKVSKSFQYGNQTVTLETGEIARQASGAVMASMGDTVVMATVVAMKEARPGQDFFPLTVEGNPDQSPDRPPDPPTFP